MLCGLVAMYQASVLDGLSFDPFSFQQDGLAAPEVDVSRGQIGDGLVVSYVVVSAVTANTITQKDKLEDQLATIRNKGYAIDSEENETGANCVAAPSRDGLGEIVGSISVSGLASRTDRTKLVDLVAIIIKEASAISILLGNRPGS